MGISGKPARLARLPERRPGSAGQGDDSLAELGKAGWPGKISDRLQDRLTRTKKTP